MSNRPVPVLDSRLAAAAAYVRQGCTAADIGCDHGKLSVALAAGGKCKKVIASDIRPAPLAMAQNLVARCNCGSIVECRLGAGLSVLHPGEADDIIIAGVSGVTICEILAEMPESFYEAKPGMRLILIPATKHPVLRRYLAGHGFSLRDETPVKAAGRYYTVMLAEYTGKAETPDDYFCVAGCAAHGAQAQGYLCHEAMLLEKEAIGAEGAEKEKLLKLAEQVKETARKCRI